MKKTLLICLFTAASLHAMDDAFYANNFMMFETLNQKAMLDSLHKYSDTQAPLSPEAKTELEKKLVVAVALKWDEAVQKLLAYNDVDPNNGVDILNVGRPIAELFFKTKGFKQCISQEDRKSAYETAEILGNQFALAYIRERSNAQATTSAAGDHLKHVEELMQHLKHDPHAK